MLIDSHAHLSAQPLLDQVDAILARAKATNIEKVVNICTDPENLQEGLRLAESYSWLYNAGAVHPHDAASLGESFFSTIATLARQKKLIALGETGLDYHYNHSPAEIQQECLRKHLLLALECELPVIIHCRLAFPDFFRILDETYCPNGRHGPGVLHCFTGTAEEAKNVLDRGFYISFSGVVTFKKSEELRKVVQSTPLDRMLIETDAPYLAPQSHRGKTNEPAFVKEVAEVIAAVKQLPFETVAEATTANAKKLFSF